MCHVSAGSPSLPVGSATSFSAHLFPFSGVTRALNPGHSHLNSASMDLKKKPVQPGNYDALYARTCPTLAITICPKELPQELPRLPPFVPLSS